METPPAVPGGGAETLAAAKVKAIVEEKAAKRARKRSRYLSSDYVTATLNDDHADHDDDIAVSPKKGEEDAAALLLRLQEANLATADLLAELLRSAASPTVSSPGPGVDAGVLLRFFALHRASVLPTNCEHTSTTTDHYHSEAAAAAAAAGHMHGLPNTCTALAADGSVGKKQDAAATGQIYDAHHIGPANTAAALAEDERKRKKKNKDVAFAMDVCNTAAADCSAQPATSSSMGHAYGHQIRPAYAAAAASEAGPKKRRRRKKKTTFALDAHDAAAVAGCSAPPTTGNPGGANSVPKKVRNRFGRGQHAGKPVALLLDFPKGCIIHPPSKEDLLSTFRGFGSLIESETDIGTRRARLVFRSSAAAEAAYSCAHTLGTFSARRLQYLRPPPPAPMIPLTDVRKNLEKMIAALTGASVLGREGALDLAGQMLRLKAKVDKTLCAAGPGPSTATAPAHLH